MKSISYLDMVREILNESEFSQFEKCYNSPVKKSIKILNHRGYKNQKSDLYNIIYSTFSNQRDLSEPDFSFYGNKYKDVLFATRKENLKSASLGSHFLHQAGLIYVQEMAASLSVQMLGIQPGDYVLDMCAAPGGKSVQIADSILSSGPQKPHPTPLLIGEGKHEVLGEVNTQDSSSQAPQNDDNVGFIISNEIDSGRKKALESNLHRCGIFNIGVTNQDGRILGDRFSEIFDKVLVDAPCSGEGMQYKSDKKIRNRDEKKSQKLSELQIQLVDSGLKSLKVGGEMVYSTCTTNILENEYVVSEILKKYGDKIEILPVPLEEKSDGISTWHGNEILSSENAKKVARLRPHVHGTGGFFIAKFRKCLSFGPQKPHPTPLLLGEGKHEVLGEVKIRENLSTWGIQPISDLDFFVSKYTVNIAPKSLIQSHFENRIPNIEIGLPIFKIVENKKNNSQKLIPLVGISQIFGHLATQNVLEITDEQLKSIMEKRDLIDERLKDYEGNFVILKRNGVGIGLVSVQKGIGKNKCF